MDLKGTFTRKIGPLPAIAWAGIAGGVYVAYKYATKPKVAANPDGTVTAFAPLDTSNSDISSGTTTDTGGTTASSYVQSATLDNTTWGKEAVNWLISTGVLPTDAANAISAYLYGSQESLNSTQSAALNGALSHFGSPPEGVIAPPIVTTNPAVTQPVPVSSGIGNPASMEFHPPVPPPTLINFGQEGTPGWAATFMQDGVLRWVTNGDEYARLRDSGVQRLDLTAPDQQAAYLNSLKTISAKTSGQAPSTFDQTLVASWGAQA